MALINCPPWVHSLFSVYPVPVTSYCACPTKILSVDHGYLAGIFNVCPRIPEGGGVSVC